MNILKSLRKNTIILVIITIIILYIVLKDDFNGTIDALIKLDVKFIILALLFFVLSVSIKGYVNYKIVNDKEKISLLEAIKHNFIAQFFNGVTPFAAGGQPMEVYMITEHKISIASATNYTIQSFIFYQIALVICGFIAVGLNCIFDFFPKIKILQMLVVVGFIINILVAIVLLLISSSKKTTHKLSKLTIKICKKLKINIDEKEIESKFEDFHLGFKLLKKKRRLTIAGIILNIASLLCLYIVPIFVLYGMGDFTSLTAIETISASAYVYLIGSFVPIPGASGGIEYGFTQFYGTFIEGSKLSAVLLIWRFITYYLGIILGALMFNFEKKENNK